MWMWLTFVVSLGLGGLVSALHHSLRDFSLVKMQEIVDERGGKGSIDRVLEDVDGHALVTGALRAVANVVITVCVVLMFRALRVEPALEESGALVPTVTVSFGRMAGAAAVASGLIYLVSLVIALSVAEHMGERLIHACRGFLVVAHFLAGPIRAVSVVDVAVRRLAGAEVVSEAEEIEDVILSAVTEGQREGNLGDTQREMIEAVVEFKTRTVEDVMTPRTEIEGIEMTDDLVFIRGFLGKAGHSRIPVFVGDLDHIVGILYAKDLLPWLGREASEFRLRPILRKPVWAPETKPLMDMLYELRARKVHIAVVLDEYGGTTGLVSFEDILEEIVGEIQDEYEHHEEALPEIRVDAVRRSAEIDARANIDDANESLGEIGVELPESEEYDTVGGWVLATLGHIPAKGESFASDGVRVTVLEAEATRVTRVLVESRGALGEEEGEDVEVPGDMFPGLRGERKGAG